VSWNHDYLGLLGILHRPEHPLPHCHEPRHFPIRADRGAADAQKRIASGTIGRRLASRAVGTPTMIHM